MTFSEAADLMVNHGAHIRRASWPVGYSWHVTANDKMWEKRVWDTGETHHENVTNDISFLGEDFVATDWEIKNEQKGV